MGLPTRKPKYEPRVDGPKRKLTRLRTRPNAIHVFQQPLQLGAGQVRIEDQAGALAKERLLARFF